MVVLSSYAVVQVPAMVVEVLCATLADFAVIASGEPVFMTINTIPQILNLLHSLFNTFLDQWIHRIPNRQHDIIIANHEDEKIVQSQQKYQHRVFRNSYYWWHDEYWVQYQYYDEDNYCQYLLCCWWLSVCIDFLIFRCVRLIWWLLYSLLWALIVLLHPFLVILSTI